MCFNIEKRGYIREGYYADLVAVFKKRWKVTKDNILYACKWSPLEKKQLDFQISHTFVNGNLVYHNGVIQNITNGKALSFSD
jgi:dihydroorotase